MMIDNEEVIKRTNTTREQFEAEGEGGRGSYRRVFVMDSGLWNIVVAFTIRRVLGAKNSLDILL